MKWKRCFKRLPSLKIPACTEKTIQNNMRPQGNFPAGACLFFIVRPEILAIVCHKFL